eukprot:4383515-Amphidinium_carterae.1
MSNLNQKSSARADMVMSDGDERRLFPTALAHNTLASALWSSFRLLLALLLCGRGVSDVRALP